MSPAAPRRNTWLRALVLLLALLVPGAHSEAYAVPVTAMASEAAEPDVLDTALRLPMRGCRRPAAPLRPAAPAVPHTPRCVPAPPRPPYGPPTPRSVILRC